MADWITYKLTGATELSRVFKTLPAEVQRQVMIPAAKDAMDIVLKDAINRASIIDRPETIPDISKNIAMVEDKKYFNETGATKISVGVRKSRKGQRGGNTFYWWWVELGDSRSRAQPFLRNALAQNREAVFAELISSGKYQLIKLGLN